MIYVKFQYNAEISCAVNKNLNFM